MQHPHHAVSNAREARADADAKPSKKETLSTKGLKKWLRLSLDPRITSKAYMTTLRGRVNKPDSLE